MLQQRLTETAPAYGAKRENLRALNFMTRLKQAMRGNEKLRVGINKEKR